MLLDLIVNIKPHFFLVIIKSRPRNIVSKYKTFERSCVMAAGNVIRTPFPLENSNLFYVHGFFNQNLPCTPPPEKQNFHADPPRNIFWIHSCLCWVNRQVHNSKSQNINKAKTNSVMFKIYAKWKQPPRKYNIFGIKNNIFLVYSRMKFVVRTILKFYDL